MIMEIKELNICELDEVKNQTWGTGINKRLVLVGLKLSGEISEDEKHALLAEAWKRTTDHCTQSFQGTDRRGRGLLLVFDVYVVKQLSVLKRLRHAARMFKAAITGNVHVGSGVRVVVIK